MGKRALGIIILAIIIVAGAAVALTHKSNNGNSLNPYSNSNTTQNTPNNNTSSNSNQAAATGNVEIKNMMFTPSQITVAKGGKVTWTNNDNTAHTVTDDLTNVGGPDSGLIQPGGTYSFTFTKTGSFQYHCSIHTSMRGTIVVK